MTVPLTSHIRAVVLWSAAGAALGVLIGLAILLIDARWYAVSPEPGVVISRQATVPGLVIDGCEGATFRVRLSSAAPGQGEVVSFEGCLGDHALGEAVAVRRQDGRISVDLMSPLSAAGRVGVIAAVFAALGALIAVRDAVLRAVVMTPVALFRRWRTPRIRR